MTKPTLRISVLDKLLYAANALLAKDRKYTFIDADVSAASSTITVESIVGFSTDQILLIGDIGNENSEIIKTHASTSPTGTTITFASNTVFAHTQGDKVYIISYDQIEFSRAATAAGTKTVMTTIALQPDQAETQYRDTSWTTGARYGFVRFKDTINTTYSPYSDAVLYTGWATNEAGKVIETALKRNKLDTFTDNVDHQFCIDEINSCLKYILGKRKKWHRLQQFDYELGQTADSEYAFAVPSDMWGYSNKSVLDIHLEGEEPLTYKDEREWNEMLEDVIYDQLSAAASATDTAIYLDNSYSFDDTGTVLCRGDEIDYTVNTVATGKLTCTALDNDLADDSMVWKGDYETGLPLYYTIKEGYVLIYPFPDSDYDNINVMLDYWKEAPEVDSDADTLDISRYDMVKHWLVWAIRSQVMNNGMRDPSDADYLMFERMLRDALYIEANTSGQKYKMSPKLNTIKY